MGDTLTRSESLDKEKALVRADALDRAWRTFKQQILLDALLSSGTGILVLADKVDPTTAEFWTAAGVLFGKSLVASGVAYLHRLRSKPKAPAENLQG